MAFSDSIKARIQDLKDRIDRLDADYAVKKAELQARLQALKDLKAVFNQAQSDALDKSGVELPDL